MFENEFGLQLFKYLMSCPTKTVRSINEIIRQNIQSAQNVAK